MSINLPYEKKVYYIEFGDLLLFINCELNFHNPSKIYILRIRKCDIQSHSDFWILSYSLHCKPVSWAHSSQNLPQHTKCTLQF